MWVSRVVRSWGRCIATFLLICVFLSARDAAGQATWGSAVHSFVHAHGAPAAISHDGDTLVLLHNDPSPWLLTTYQWNGAAWVQVDQFTIAETLLLPGCEPERVSVSGDTLWITGSCYEALPSSRCRYSVQSVRFTRTGAGWALSQTLNPYIGPTASVGDCRSIRILGVAGSPSGFEHVIDVRTEPGLHHYYRLLNGSPVETIGYFTGQGNQAVSFTVSKNGLTRVITSNTGDMTQTAQTTRTTGTPRQGTQPGLTSGEYATDGDILVATPLSFGVFLRTWTWSDAPTPQWVSSDAELGASNAFPVSLSRGRLVVSYGGTLGVRTYLAQNIARPNEFTLTGPANGTAVPCGSAPTLTWQPAAMAASYTVWLATSSNMQQNRREYLGVTGTSFAVPLAHIIPGATHYWMVQAVNSVGTRQSTAPTGTFTVGGGPSAFGLTSPANGASGVALNATFSWSAATGANGYTFTLARDPALTDTVTTQTLGAATTSLPAGTGWLSSGTTYYWRVSATSASCGPTNGSPAVSSFSTGTIPPPQPFSLSTPSGGSAVCTGGGATFSWSASANASEYRFVIGTFLNPETSAIYTADPVTGTSITVPAGVFAGLGNGTDLNWTVTARNTSGTRAASNGYQTFRSLTDGPNEATLVSPPDMSRVAVAPLLQWSNPAANTSQRVQVATTPAFAPPLIDQAVGGASFQIPGGVLSPGGTYYWRIIGMNPCGSPYPGGARWFELNNAPPGEFELSSPTVGAVVCEPAPMFGWTSSANATRYTLEVARDPAVFDLAYTASDLTQTTHTPPVGALVLGEQYWWRVTATNASASRQSLARGFTLEPALGSFQLTAPLPGELLSGVTPTLAWTAANNTASYTVKVSTSPTLMPTVWTTTATGLSATVPPGLLVFDQRYYWGVVAGPSRCGEVASTPAVSEFITPQASPSCPAEVCPDVWSLEATPPNIGNVTYDRLALARDETRGVIVAVGGRDPAQFGVEFRHTLEFDGVTWVLRSAAAAPAGEMVYDHQRSQVIMCDGSEATFRTWAWNGTAWTLIATGGPSRRSAMAVASDSVRRRVVLFGGYDTQLFTHLADTWEWDGSDWALFSGAAPPSGFFPSMAYDPVRRVSVLLTFGGPVAPDPGFVPQTWSWDGTRWALLSSLQTPDSQVAPTLVWSEPHESLLLLNRLAIVRQEGGSIGFHARQETWTWDGKWCRGQDRPVPFHYDSENYFTRITSAALQPSGAALLVATHTSGPPARTITAGDCRCIADFNSDGGVDGSDIEAFYLVFESGEAGADVNDDGGVDGGDVQTFFELWETGAC